MSSENRNSEHDRDTADQDRDSDALSQLLRSALAEPPPPQVNFLPSVQEKIRKRTHGRYYRRRNYSLRDPIPMLLTSASLLLLIAAIVYVLFQTLLSSAEKKAPHEQSQKSSAQEQQQPLKLE